MKALDEIGYDGWGIADNRAPTAGGFEKNCRKRWTACSRVDRCAGNKNDVGMDSQATADGQQTPLTTWLQGRRSKKK